MFSFSLCKSNFLTVSHFSSFWRTYFAISYNSTVGGDTLTLVSGSTNWKGGLGLAYTLGERITRDRNFQNMLMWMRGRTQSWIDIANFLLNVVVTICIASRIHPHRSPHSCLPGLTCHLSGEHGTLTMPPMFSWMCWLVRYFSQWCALIFYSFLSWCLFFCSSGCLRLLCIFRTPTISYIGTTKVSSAQCFL